MLHVMAVANVDHRLRTSVRWSLAIRRNRYRSPMSVLPTPQGAFFLDCLQRGHPKPEKFRTEILRPLRNARLQTHGCPHCSQSPLLSKTWVSPWSAALLSKMWVSPWSLSPLGRCPLGLLSSLHPFATRPIGQLAVAWMRAIGQTTGPDAKLPAEVDQRDVKILGEPTRTSLQDGGREPWACFHCKMHLELTCRASKFSMSGQCKKARIVMSHCAK